MTRQPAATRSKALFNSARLLVPGLLLSLAGWGFAQEPAAPAPGELFEGAVDVSVVNVEVHVVDQKGEPVAGLGPDDFAVYENGQEMPITNFYAVSEGDPVDPVEIRRGAFREVPEEGVAGRFPAYLPSPEQRQLHLVGLAHRHRAHRAEGPGRHVHQPELFISGKNAPGVGRAARVGCAAGRGAGSTGR